MLTSQCVSKTRAIEDEFDDECRARSENWGENVWEVGNYTMHCVSSVNNNNNNKKKVL